MPALTANSVTLSEVLEVRGSFLKEDELWAVLSQSSEALQDVFLKGKVRQKGLVTYTITPEGLLLCHNGRVKFSLHPGLSRNRSFMAPELYSKHSKPSEGALEKICIYSLGMSLYHAAEYEIPVGKPINLSESLESILLSMCEESSQLRVSLSQVLEVCHRHRRRGRFKDQIASMVAGVLGDDVPDNDDEDFDDMEETVDRDLSEFLSGQSPSISPNVVSPHSLPSPPPSRVSTRGQPTAEQLVGSNHRQSGSPTELTLSPLHSRETHVPHVLDKYRGHLERVRRDQRTSMLDSSQLSIDQLQSTTGHQSPTNVHHQSRLERSAVQRNGTLGSQLSHPVKSSPRSSGHYRQSSLPDDVLEAGYFEGPAKGLRQESRPRPDLVPGVSQMRTYGSETSLADSCSVVSGPPLSDGRSSMVSITQGSYAPESYLTDGYESEPYLTSIGSSASRAAFRQGRDPRMSRNRPYSSTMDLRKSMLNQSSISSLPAADEVDYMSHHAPPQRFLSVPDIHVSAEAPKSKGGSKTKLKTFFGPEFVQVAEDPNLSVVNISPRVAGSIPRGRRMVTVIMLNGQKVQMMIETTTTTQVLFDQVIKYLGLTEKIFFGLSQLQDGEHIFLDLDVKLTKYAPPKWKEEAKVPSEPFLLNFRVKFYVENVALLSHQKTKHQFYLQLRKDILDNQLYGHEEASFILGGLALQAETGDYHDSLGDQYFLPEHYITQKVINKVSVDRVCHELPRSHKMFSGLTEEQAELEFIQEAQKLQEYGIHFYKVYATKKSEKDCVWLGICVRGVTVYEARGHVKFPVHRHSWPMTKKLSFKKKKFFIEPRGNPEPPKLTFYTNHYKKSRYLLQLSQAFHRFQMKMRARLATIEQEEQCDKPGSRVGNGLASGLSHRPSPYKRSSTNYPQPSLHGNGRQESLGFKQELPDYPLRSHEMDSRRYSASDESEGSTIYHEQGNLSRQLSQDMEDVDMPYVIDSTLNSQAGEAPKSRELPTAEYQDGGSTEVLTSPDREIRVIKFRKEPEKGLGITVLGGENSKRLDLGIYVKSVAEGGAAGKDGRLKAGDRILAVNGQSLERVTHEQAVSILKNASSPVELVLSQSSYKVSSFDLSSIPSASTATKEPESLEVKTLTPRDTPSLQPESHPQPTREGSPEPRPSNFTFPSEDEPVTMISKSIPPSLVSTQNAPSRRRQPNQDLELASKDNSSFKSEGVRDRKGQPAKNPPLETRVVETSLLSATAPLVSASLITTQSWSSDTEPNSALSREGSRDETGSCSEDELPEKAFVVDLEKKDGSLGLSVTGGINTTVKLGGIYVKSLQPNGPADLDSRIQIGDRILAVNGISLVGVTHKQAVETIKMAPQTSRLVLDRSVPVIIPKTAGKKVKPQAFDKPFLVELIKGVGGLGLSLVGGEGAGEEHGGLLRIKKMFPGQPAASCGKLQIGDIVLEVNGTDMKGVTHQEAVNLIRLGLSQVKLLVKRDPSSIPSSLLHRAGSNASDVDPAQLLADIQTKLRTDDSPSLSERSSVSSTREPLSSKSNSLDLQREVVTVKDPEASVSLRSSLLSEEPKPSRISFPVMSRNDKDRPGLQNRFSEPVMLVKKGHGLLAQTNSLPNVVSVTPAQEFRANTSVMVQESNKEIRGDGDAPLAEDESSDVEDSRRSSSIDLIPPDHSVFDQDGIEKLIGRLSSVESTKEDDVVVVNYPTESDKSPSVSQEKMIPDESMPSPPSSDSEESEPEDVRPVEKMDNSVLPTALDAQETQQAQSLTPQEELLDIELVKGAGGLGFTLAGGANTMGGCFVRDIVEGPAKEDGRLQKGDQIMSVDGVDISIMKHMDAVNVLRATKQRVKLVVLRRPSGLVGTTSSGTAEVVNLTRTSQGRIGLLIKEGDDGKICVEDVVPGEPAATQGNLRQGDKILEINGVKVDGVGFVAARQQLDAARPVARLLVERRPRVAESKYTMGDTSDSRALSPTWSVDRPDRDPVEFSDDDNNNQDRSSDLEKDEKEEDAYQDEQFTIKLDKGPRGFGFSLVAAPTINSDSQGIFIKTISPGSVAENDGRLRVGDQILKVNDEDVQGLSHARVIGMLRKISGHVELDIKRPGKLHILDSITNSPTLRQKSVGNLKSPSQRAPLERAPLSVDLDITLEDKDRTLTRSSSVEDEDDVTELLNAISRENNQSSPPTRPKDKPRPPKLQKRDTDSVLSSLLESLEPPPSPPDSVASVDPRDFDSQWESGYSDNDAPPDLVPDKSYGSRLSPFGTGSSRYRNDLESGQFDGTQSLNPLSNKEQPITVPDYKVNIRGSEDDNDEDDDDVDADVFDMLRDNSQVVIDMLNSKDVLSNSVQNAGSNNSLNVRDGVLDVPPPIPTTPLPSDDDEEPPVRPPERRESLQTASTNQASTEMYSERMVNGSLSAHGSTEDVPGSTEPLIDVMEGGRYTGQELNTLIKILQEKINSNLPADEFKALREIKPTDGCDTGKRPANKDKNRYRNVLPFDKTRVKLSGNGDDSYINANHVKVSVGEDVYSYIATQGPLPITTQDFWQMVWEQEVDVIAMVTLEREGGKEKCHRYWPESDNQPLVFPGSLKVSLQKQEDFDAFIEREFIITNLKSGEDRTVNHINFTKWPDHGVPKSAVELVEFVRFMRLLADGPGPVVVHCSAGIGRTGTLITIDVAIGLMERDLTFDVNKIIWNLREQRQGMIQTKDQYIFCYKACLDVLLSLTAD